MKNIHVIKSNKPSRLWTNNLRRRLELDEFPSQHPTNIAKNIYITSSDEEIKDGDWYFNNTGSAIERLTYKLPSGGSFCKKIILTTDEDLIKDGVQAIDDEFLQWFVKNPSCEEVEVESFCKHGDNCPSQGAYDKQYLCDIGYKIIIPKEEPKKSFGEIWSTLTPEQSDYLKGYINRQVENAKKWQKERMYSEKDLKEAWEDGRKFEHDHNGGEGGKFTGAESFEEWLIQSQEKT
jgi:hypothetical protein